MKEGEGRRIGEERIGGWVGEQEEGGEGRDGDMKTKRVIIGTKCLERVTQTSPRQRISKLN